MRCSIEPRDRIFVKGFRFLSCANNMDKGLSSKYGQNLLDNTKNSTIDAHMTALKRAIQKAAEETLDLVKNKIEEEITKSSTENPKNMTTAQIDRTNNRDT